MYFTETTQPIFVRFADHTSFAVRGAIENLVMMNASSDSIDDGLNELSHRVIGAALDVHRHLGPGHFESVYERALRVELELRGISFRAQPAIGVTYKGVSVGEFVPDLIVDNRLIVELKATESITDVHLGQALAYLRLSDLRLALVVNFHARLLKGGGIRRVAN